MSSLATFLMAISGSLAARVLTGLGIGIVSYAAISTLIATVNELVIANFNSLGSFALKIVNLAGGGQAVAIICAAFVVKGSLMAIKSMRPV